MRVFITGATGFIGTHLVPELLQAGHQVVGLTRSDEGAQALRAAGADVHRGSLEEPDTLRHGAEGADAVVHLAYDHDFANMAASGGKETRAIAALGEATRSRTARSSSRPWRRWARRPPARSPPRTTTTRTPPTRARSRRSRARPRRSRA